MIKYKHPELYYQLVSNEVHPEVRMLAVVINTWLGQFGLDLTITAVLEEKGVARKSSTHKGRAFDLRISNLPRAIPKKLADWVNNNFSTGIIDEYGEPMLVAVLESDHIHIQIPKGKPLIIYPDKDQLML